MPDVRSFNAQRVCMDLLLADNEGQVLEILNRHGLDADCHWQPLGGIENNLSIAGNQQSCATAALVEKLVNSIDSLLILECLLRGTDVESRTAPPSMIEASAAFFGIPDGNIARLDPPHRARLAELVQLVATGSKQEPCLTIIDQGEGQRPCDFRDTFCSLVRSNKLRVPFVQGKYNMGGCGVLPFCGRRNIQLIVSRRHPRLVAGQHGRENVGWGWTLVRRREPDGNRRSSFYEYLAPNGAVPCFEAESIPVLPTRDAAHGKPLSWGSLVKLYNYQMERPTAIVFDLNFELSRRLYHLALPVRLYERRADYRGHSMGTILTGMSVRLEDDRAGVLEPGFPDSGVIHVQGVGNVPIQITVFKKAKGRNFVSSQASILFTVNGQVHGNLGNRFCSRQAVRLDYLKNDLMVVLDCTQIPPRVREDLFMPSRDRLRVCDPKQAFEIALEAYLGDHEELHRLNAQRREEELRGRLADDRPFTEALKSVIQSSPELRSLFQPGVRVPTTTVSGTHDDAFVGVKFPTYFRLVPEPNRGTVARIECPLGGHGRARFETDAANDYFTRGDEPGTITVRPEGVFDRVQLRDGKATLVLACPEHSAVGDVVDVSVAVTDPSRTEPFCHRLQLVIAPAREPKTRERSERHRRSGALALPKVVEIDRDEWESVDFDGESGLTMHGDTDGGLVAKVNIANEHLRQAMERAPESDCDLLRKRFVYGLVLAGVSLWREFSDKEDCDELIRTSTKAISRVLLPTISVLGSLEHVLVGAM